MSPDTPDPHRPADAPAGPQPDGTPTPPGDDPAGSYLPWPPPYAGLPQPPDERPRHTPAVALALVLGLTVLGAPLGLLWAALAPDTPVVKTAEGAVYAQSQPEQPIAADGWFSLLGLGFGVLAAIAVWVLLRRRRGPVALAAVTVGALGAALVAWQVGRRIGLDGYQRLLATAPVGTPFDKPADLRAGGIERVFDVLPVPYGNLLLPAFAVAVTYTLLAGWSRWPSLRPEPMPDWSNGPGAAGWPEPAVTGRSGGPDAAGDQDRPSAVGGAGGVSWGPAGTPAPTTAPEPPAPGAAGSTRD
ncbi:DUF2567 domain-containing protein [Micromonospora sp. NPDC051925]|uniref:DUF2567 domain-containing protein n=1 Tax=Micromonospora sp. NPDC051925 TaxID=3364288 RepID=UPI0037CA790F